MYVYKVENDDCEKKKKKKNRRKARWSMNLWVSVRTINLNDIFAQISLTHIPYNLVLILEALLP